MLLFVKFGNAINTIIGKSSGTKIKGRLPESMANGLMKKICQTLSCLIDQKNKNEMCVLWKKSP